MKRFRFWIEGISGEHAMSVVVAIYETPSDDISGWIAKYCRASHAFVFSEPLLPYYSSWVGVLILIASNVATFAWNFTDLFIILISNALTSHFVNFNDHVRQAVTGNKDKQISTSQNFRCVSTFTLKLLYWDFKLI